MDSVPVAVAAAFGFAGLVAGLVVGRLRLAPAAPGSTRGGLARLSLLAAGGAILGLWSTLGQTSVAAAILTALFAWQLLLIAVVDAEHFWLPDRLTFPLAATGLIAAAALDERRLVDSVIGAAVGFAALWLLARAYRRLRGREGLGAAVGGHQQLLQQATLGCPARSCGRVSRDSASSLAGRRRGVRCRAPTGCRSGSSWPSAAG